MLRLTGVEPGERFAGTGRIHVTSRQPLSMAMKPARHLREKFSCSRGHSHRFCELGGVRWGAPSQISRIGAGQEACCPGSAPASAATTCSLTPGCAYDLPSTSKAHQGPLEAGLVKKAVAPGWTHCQQLCFMQKQLVGLDKTIVPIWACYPHTGPGPTTLNYSPPVFLDSLLAANARIAGAPFRYAIEVGVPGLIKNTYIETPEVDLTNAAALKGSLAGPSPSFAGTKGVTYLATPAPGASLAFAPPGASYNVQCTAGFTAGPPPGVFLCAPRGHGTVTNGLCPNNDTPLGIGCLIPVGLMGGTPTAQCMGGNSVLPTYFTGPCGSDGRVYNEQIYDVAGNYQTITEAEIGVAPSMLRGRLERLLRRSIQYPVR